MPSETSLEKQLSTAVKALGGISVKLPSLWYKGIPDRMLLLPGGRIYFVELKKKASLSPEPHQVWWMVRLHRLGFDVRAVCGPEQLFHFISEIKVYKYRRGMT